MQRLIAQLLGHGKSAKTVRNVHVVIHRALEQARPWRPVNVNVADLVDPPRNRRLEMKP